MKKTFSTVIILLVISFASTAFPTLINADEKTPSIEFILHKKMYEDSNATPDYRQNTGTEMDFSNEATYGLNDVTFEVYDVTNWVSEELQTKPLETLMADVMNTKTQKLQEKFSRDTDNPLLQEIVTTSVADEAGVAIVDVNPTVNNSAYLFLETSAPTIAGQEIHELAAPMLVVLPIENPSVPGSYLSTIHLYPKNFGFDEPVKPTEPPKPSKPEESTPGKPSKPSKPSQPGKPSLPVTGEAKSMISILGIVILVIAFLLYRKQLVNRSNKNNQ